MLVEVNRKDIYCDSSVVAKKFGIKHAFVVKVIENVLNDYPDLRVASNYPKNIEKYYIEDRHYRGTNYKAYMMNRPFFSLVCMRFTSGSAREWQRKFNAAFYEMEKRLLQFETNASDIEWNQSRLIGKQARIIETDAIKMFVDYATAQGSKNAKNYYKHITNATYKALGLMAQRHPKLRDQMDIYQISELMLAEKFAAGKLTYYVGLKREYHDIYDSVRDDLINFANAIRIC